MKKYILPVYKVFLNKCFKPCDIFFQMQLICKGRSVRVVKRCGSLEGRPSPPFIGRRGVQKKGTGAHSLAKQSIKTTGVDGYKKSPGVNCRGQNQITGNEGKKSERLELRSASHI